MKQKTRLVMLYVENEEMVQLIISYIIRAINYHW